MAYKDIVRNAITTFEDLEKWLTGQKARVDPRLRDVIAKSPMRVTTYYLGLIQKMNDPIWKQAIPDVEELEHHRDLVEVLRKHTPRSLKDPHLFMNTHFNHPNEITEQAFQAVKVLRDLGIPMGNQTVLPKGVHNDTDVMRDLVHGLGRLGVRPYYLSNADLVEGKPTRHNANRTQEGRTVTGQGLRVGTAT